MRIALIFGLLSGVLIGVLLGNQVATSQEEILPMPDRDGRGRFLIAGHSTYPPLLLDSDTGASWLLMSESDGEERRWIWEPIEMGVLSPQPSPSQGRDIVRLPDLPRPFQRQTAFSRPRSFAW
jgi:hypothetical protein